MSEWLTIDSAPKNGTWIVIGKAGWDAFPRAMWGEADGEDGPFFGWVFADDSVWVPNACEDGFLGWQEDIDDGAMPTHWMPEPPVQS